MNKKIFKDESVHPRKHLKEIKLYVYNPKGQLIWTGHSQLIFLDICCQIAQNKLEGYYVVNSLKERAKIKKTGYVVPNIKINEKMDERWKIIMGF